MDLQTLDDLIALAETRSVTEAAQRRHVTQPAFSRRVRAIEEYLGIQVLRRDTRPARPTDTLLRNLDEIRGLAFSLRRLRSDLLHTANPERVLSVAALHAIAVAHLPAVLKRLTGTLPFSRIRLRAANRDECFAWLMTGQVAFMLVYETDQTVQPVDPALVERTVVRTEAMIPMATPELARHLSEDTGLRARIPMIGYPEDSVLGGILRDEVLPVSAGGFTLAATTAFSPAVMELCAHGLGVAWLPRRLAAEKLARGELMELSDRHIFPNVTMKVTMLRVRGAELAGFLGTAWDTMSLLMRTVDIGHDTTLAG